MRLEVQQHRGHGCLLAQVRCGLVCHLLFTKELKQRTAANAVDRARVLECRVK
jgi:hypothetical protein